MIRVRVEAARSSRNVTGRPSDLRFPLVARLFLAMVMLPGGALSQEDDMKKLTPVPYVETIEPAIPFWEGRLGFERTMEVPGSDGLDFVAFQKGGVELMYQTRASVLADLPELAGSDIVRPRSITFYGSTEIAVREPGGNVVIFAEMASD